MANEIETLAVGQQVRLSDSWVAALERQGVDLASPDVGGAGPLGTIGAVISVDRTDLGEGEWMVRYRVQWPHGTCSYDAEHLSPVEQGR